MAAPSLTPTVPAVSAFADACVKYSLTGAQAAELGRLLVALAELGWEGGLPVDEAVRVLAGARR
jgi:hypothetical protein